MSKLPTIAVCGWGRAGKDTFGEFLSYHTPLRYTGSLSWYGLSHMAKLLGLCPQAAWERRHKMRQFWKDELDKFRDNDHAGLIKMALACGEIVVGVRDKRELIVAKSQGLLDFTVWVDRPCTVKDPTVTYDATDCSDYFANTLDIAGMFMKVRKFAEMKGIPLRPESEASTLFKNYLDSTTPEAVSVVEYSSKQQASVSQ